ncbi:hypothetical protein ABZ027_30710 [Streptomyces sp. NPDC006332]|uniref:hypothetical protein n=1 Tax=Streptomyces sp. NPDC006332 TaxID=3155456 RepID=UPI0033A7135B
MHTRPDSSPGTQRAPTAPPVSTPVRTEADAHFAAGMSPPEDEGLAEVRIIAEDPVVTQRVALLLRHGFHCDEPRSYPAGPDGQGTLLHLTVDTRQPPDDPPTAADPWLISSRSQASRTHPDEPC